MKKNIAIVAGTRPECIKMAPVYFELKKSNLLHPVFLATAQHRQMLDQTLAVFGIKPEYDLDLMRAGQTLPDLTGRVISAVSEWITEHRPDAMLVQGDTTSVLGAAMAAFYAHVPIGHVEAGLRTNNMLSPFPEEMNRRLTSPLAKWNFCPTEVSRRNLLSEGIFEKSCYVTGNTVIDALFIVREKLRLSGVDGRTIATNIGIPKEFTERFLIYPKAKWILVTGHRRESFGEGFENICKAINRITREHSEIGILYPVHLNPQVQEPVTRILGNNNHVALVSPASYEDFIWLLDHCYFALSDSGGVQEEAPSLGKPVLVMRETTERPEGILAGTCRLVGTNQERIYSEAKQLIENQGEYVKRASLKNPYGNGDSAVVIRQILEAHFENDPC